MQFKSFNEVQTITNFLYHEFLGIKTRIFLWNPIVGNNEVHYFSSIDHGSFWWVIVWKNRELVDWFNGKFPRTIPLIRNTQNIKFTKKNLKFTAVAPLHGKICTKKITTPPPCVTDPDFYCPNLLDDVTCCPGEHKNSQQVLVVQRRNGIVVSSRNKTQYCCEEWLKYNKKWVDRILKIIYIIFFHKFCVTYYNKRKSCRNK